MRPHDAWHEHGGVPLELLDESREVARAAERMAQRFLGDDAARETLTGRLAWAIAALERAPSTDEPGA